MSSPIQVNMASKLLNIFAAAFGMALSGMFLYLSATSPLYPGDYIAFLRSAAGGGFEGFYYFSYFLLPVKLFTILPFQVSYLLWNGLNILGFIAAAKHFGAKVWLGLLSYPMQYNLYYGNIGGFMAFGLMLLDLGGWWSGIGAALLLVKPQVGVILILIALLKGNRIKILLPVFGCLLAGLLAYGWLLPLDRIMAVPPVTDGSIALWDFVGPLALLVFIPLLWKRDFKMAAAAGSLGQPYFQVTGLLPLLAMETGYLGLIVYLGFLMPIWSWPMIDLIALFPLIVLIRDGFRALPFRQRQTTPTVGANLEIRPDQ